MQRLIWLGLLVGGCAQWAARPARTCHAVPGLAAALRATPEVSGEGGAQTQLPTAVQFLISVADRAAEPYCEAVIEEVRAELERRFGGWSQVGATPMPGGWIDPATGKRERELSWRYEVMVGPARIAELDDLLARLGRELGQAALYRVVYQADVGTITAK
jgi:hypothetical protein